MIRNFIWSHVTIQYMENNVYLLFKWKFVPPDPLPTSSSPQPPPSWQPPACPGDPHLNHTLCHWHSVILLCCRRHGRLRYDWLPGAYNVWWWHDCKLKNVDLDRGFPNAALFRVLHVQSAPYRSTVASPRLLELSVPVSWGSWKGKDRLSAYEQHHLDRQSAVTYSPLDISFQLVLNFPHFIFVHEELHMIINCIRSLITLKI